MDGVAGAVLAAGSGTRLGTPKGELLLGGERLVDRAVRVVHAAGCTPVVAVVRDGVTVTSATAVVNPDPDRGQRSSLELAVTALPDAAAVLVLLVDLPGIDAHAVRAVAAAWRPGRIAVGAFAGRRGPRRGHPIVMAPPLWRRALELAGPDEGARELLRARPDLVDEVAVTGDPTDLDTPDDLARWRAGGSSPG